MSSFRSRLIGTWELLAFEGVNVDDPKDVVKQDLHGYIMYNPDGYMSVLLQSNEVLRNARTPGEGSSEDMTKLAKQIETYAGPFRVEETGDNKATVYHETQLAVRTALIGQRQVRLGEMFSENGELYLNLSTAEPALMLGAKRDIIVRWKRAKEGGQ